MRSSTHRKLAALEHAQRLALGQRIFVGYAGSDRYQETGSAHVLSGAEIDALAAQGWHCIKVEIEHVDVEVSA